jgi:hypothetical protein
MVRTTVVFAAILLTPLAASLAYLALDASPREPTATEPEPAPTVVATTPVAPAPEPATAPVAPVVAPAPEPAPAPAPEPAGDPELELDPELAQLLDEPTPEPDLSDAQVIASPQALLLHEGALVLATTPDLAWAHGRMKVTKIDDGFNVRRAVKPASLPAALRAADGARYTLYDGDGKTCDAVVADLGLYGEWSEQAFDEPPEDGERRNIRTLAKELDPSAHVLEARLDIAGTCAPVWARRADLPAPAVFARTADDPTLQARVLDLIRDERSFKRLKAERIQYLRDLSPELRKDEPRWDAFVAANLTVTRWDERSGGRTLLNVQFKYDGGCGGFWAEQAWLLESTGDTLTLRPEAGFIDPLAVFDADRDGRFEAVTDRGRSLESRGSDALGYDYSFPAIFCPC